MALTSANDLRGLFDGFVDSTNALGYPLIDSIIECEGPRFQWEPIPYFDTDVYV